jgi:hypothetical protein
MVSGWMWLAGSQFSHNDLNYWLTANLKTLFQLYGLHNKSKAVPLHAMKALGGRGGIAPTHSRPQH